MASQTFTGIVKDAEQSSPKAPCRFLLTWTEGEFEKKKVFKVWETVKDDGKTVENPAFQFIMDNEGNEVTVRYTTREETYNGKTFPENTVWEAWAGGPKADGTFGKGAPQQNNGKTYGGNAMTDSKVRQIVREELKLAGVYSAFPGATDVTPDYDHFLVSAEFEGFNENGLAKNWKKLYGEGSWRGATQEQLEKFASELEFEWGPVKAEVGAPEGSF